MAQPGEDYGLGITAPTGGVDVGQLLDVISDAINSTPPDSGGGNTGGGQGPQGWGGSGNEWTPPTEPGITAGGIAKGFGITPPTFSPSEDQIGLWGNGGYGVTPPTGNNYGNPYGNVSAGDIGITPPSGGGQIVPPSGETDIPGYMPDTVSEGGRRLQGLLKEYRNKYGEPGAEDYGKIYNHVFGNTIQQPVSPAFDNPFRPSGGGGGGSGGGRPGYGGGGGGGGSGTMPPGGITPPTTEPGILPFLNGGPVLTFYENDLGSLPEDVRPFVERLLRQMGYSPTTFVGNYGPREYIRTGQPGQSLNDQLISAVTGGDTRRVAWLKWFLSKKGLYGAPATYPNITPPGT